MLPFDSASQQRRKGRSQPKTEAAARKPASKKPSPKKTSAKGTKGKKKTTPAKSSDRSEKEVRRDKTRAESDLQETRRRLKLNAEETSRKLNQLNLVEGEIEECNARIGVISSRIDSINSRISTLNDSIETLDTHLRQITATYIKAVRRSQGHRQNMGVLAFIFSSDSFAQAYRRVRYLRQFAKWREKRAGEITSVRKALDGKRQRLASLAADAGKSKNELSREHASLMRKKAETAGLIGELRDQGSALKEVMDEQRAQAAALDRELDNVIAREAAKREAERKAAEAERARKAAEAEAARKAAEEAARIAAAEEARKEEEQRKEEQEKEKQKKEKQRKKEGRKKTKPVRHGQKNDASAVTPAGGGAEVSVPQATAPEAESASRGIEPETGFESLKGSLPSPVSGRYTVVKRFGRQKHPSLPHVETDNAGIDLETAKGTAVRSVCGGEVSAVFRPDGYNSVVVIRHGNYMTVYANLATVSVSTGQKVKAGQNIGAVFSDPKDNGRSVLHFEIRNGRQKENPELWLKK